MASMKKMIELDKGKLKKDDLIKYLEALFQDGMSWKNMGEWHIDHKTPISAFNFTGPFDLDFKHCWALSNLQPLWAFDKESKLRQELPK